MSGEVEFSNPVLDGEQENAASNSSERASDSDASDHPVDPAVVDDLHEGLPPPSWVGALLDKHAELLLAAGIAAMLLLSALGFVVKGLAFDAGINGFYCRGTAIGKSRNTADLLRKEAGLSVNYGMSTEAHEPRALVQGSFVAPTLPPNSSQCFELGDDRATRDYRCQDSVASDGKSIQMRCARYDAVTDPAIGWGGFGCVGVYCCAAPPPNPPPPPLGAQEAHAAAAAAAARAAAIQAGALEMYEERGGTRELQLIFEDRSEVANLLTPAAFRQLCAIERSIRSFEGPGGTGDGWSRHCARKKRGNFTTPCWDPDSITTIVSWFSAAKGGCDAVLDTEVTEIAGFLSRCTNAAIVDMESLPPDCQVLALSPWGHDLNLLAGLIYWFADESFGATASSTTTKYSRATFYFEKPHDKIERKAGEEYLVALYKEVLALQFYDEDKSVKAIPDEKDMRNDITNQTLADDLLFVIIAALVVVVVVYAQTGSLLCSSLGMLHVSCAWPTTYSIYSIVFGVTWMPLFNYIGYFVILGIGADDIFVYTDAWKQSFAMLPAATPMDRRIGWAFRRAMSAMLITSATTSLAFGSNMLSTFQPIRLFGLFMGILVMVDYGYIICIYPCIVCVWHKYFVRPETLCCKIPAMPCGAKTGDYDELRLPERIYKDYIAGFVDRQKIPLAAVITIGTVMCAYIASHMSYDDEGIQQFPESHPLQQYYLLNVPGDDSPFRPLPWEQDRTGMRLKIIFGVKARDNGNFDDYTDLGTLKFVNSFDPTQIDAQRWLQQFIVSARARMDLVRQRAVEDHFRLSPTVIEEMDAWSRSMPNGTACSGGLPLASASFKGCYHKLYVEKKGRLNKPFYFDHDGRIRAIEFQLENVKKIGLRESWDYNAMRANYDAWDAFFTEQMATAPKSIHHGLFSDGSYNAPDMMYNMALACWQAGALSLACSFIIVFISVIAIPLSKNELTVAAVSAALNVSILAVIAILAIVLWVISIFVLMGWKLGIMESTCIAILVGVSVDFVVHFAHAYTHSSDFVRSGRILYSLVSMGVSVSSAAITTFLAACVLTLTTITFFFKFGVFLATAMVLSLLMSVVYYHSLLALVGPQNMNSVDLSAVNNIKDDDTASFETETAAAPTFKASGAQGLAQDSE